MFEMKSLLNSSYLYGKMSQKKLREGNQQWTDLFAIHADKRSMLKLYLWMRIWRKHKVAQRQQRAAALERQENSRHSRYSFSGKCISYCSGKVSHGTARNWKSLWKACRKNAKWTWEQNHNLKVNPLNTSACEVRVESSMMCRQISAS